MKKLQLISNKVRTNILKISHAAKSAHIASSLSIVDLLVVIYFEFINFKDKNRNIFLLSKGHACLGLYCILYEKKKITKKSLFNFGKNNSLLMSHASHHVSGVDFSTGSLGHGLPVATGLALANKIKNKKKKIFVVMSDGELNEGSTWESLLFASHHKLSNLIIIIDYNKLQSLDSVQNTLRLEPLKSKFKSFNCDVIEINGHSHKKIYTAIKKKSLNKPRVVIAHTIKGKGISFMENRVLWHYKSPDKNELEQGLMELNS